MTQKKKKKTNHFTRKIFKSDPLKESSEMNASAASQLRCIRLSLTHPEKSLKNHSYKINSSDCYPWNNCHRLL